MKLIHYSATPFIFDKDRFYEQDPHHFKPNGLWFSVEDGRGWADWCKAEDFNEPGLTNRTEIILNPHANILYLKTPEDIDWFTIKYGRPTFRLASDASINWGKVRLDYQGIIIAPYQWARRLHPSTFWYYSWDCSSGCVWDLRAVIKSRQEVAQ